MEILLAVVIILLLGGIFQIQKKLDFLEGRVNEVEDSLTEEIRIYGVDKYPKDLDSNDRALESLFSDTIEKEEGEFAERLTDKDTKSSGKESIF